MGVQNAVRGPQGPAGPVGPVGLLPSGGDDTAPINAAIADGEMLGIGTFQVSGLITGCPRGQGAALTILRASGAAARIQHGNGLATGGAQDGGEYGDFTFDGNNLAGAANPLFLSNVIGVTYRPINIQNSLGDGVIVAGQNCTFDHLAIGGCVGDGLALDNGCGGHNFYNLHATFCSGYHISFRQTVAPPGGAYGWPENNYFYGGICEQGWPFSAPTNLGCVHMQAGAINRFKDFNFFSGAGAPRLIYIEPNRAAGRAADGNYLQFFEDCFWTGSTGTLYAIECSADYNQIVGVSDEGPVLEGVNIISGAAFTAGINWPGGMPIRNEGQIKPYSLNTIYNSPNGTPMRHPRHREQNSGIYAPSVPGWVAVSVPLTALTAYFSLVVPSRPILIPGVSFKVISAADSDDQVDVGIFLEYNAKVRTAGLTSGQLNSTGVKTINFATPVQLLPGWRYYVCVATSTIGHIAAQLAMASFGDANNGFGATPGKAEVLTLGPQAAPGGCPAAMAVGGGALMSFPDGGGPVAWLPEAGTVGV